LIKEIYKTETRGKIYNATLEKDGKNGKITLKATQKKITPGGVIYPLAYLTSKEKIFYEITFDESKITFCRPIFGLRWPVFSASKENAIIEIPKQISPFEELEQHSWTRKYFTGSNSNFTPAWLKLNGIRHSLAYYGVSTRLMAITEKEFLYKISKETGIKINELR
jgi:hypothetical protein